MVKMSISGMEIKVRAVRGGSVQDIVLKGGIYKGKEYNYLVVTGKTAFLESTNDGMVLISDADAFHINAVTPLDRLAELKGKEAYLKGIETVMKGEEREILAKMISLS